MLQRCDLFFIIRSECNGGRSEPLLFDGNYQRKAAYDGVFDVLLAAPTRVDG